MTPLHIRQLFYTALLMVSLMCLCVACTKKDLVHTNTTPSNPVTDSITKALDSLPSFNGPAAVAVDAAGNIYVADNGNNVIRKIAAGGVVTTFAGSGNKGATDATGNLAAFNAPAGICIDATGNLFVSDEGSDLIRKITSSAVVTTLAGVDSAGFVNATGTSASFFSPIGIAVDATDNLYIADAGNNAIRLLKPSGLVSTFAGGDTANTQSLVAFNNPTGVALDGSGNLYVANYLNNDILLVNQAGTVSNVAGNDTLQGAVNGPGSQATFYYPNGVALDGSGNLYVSDGVNNLIRKITKAGVVSTFAGSGLPGAIDSTGTAASFNGPAGLAFDAAGNLYVADMNNNLIRKITPAGVVSTVAGSGLQGATNGIAIAHRNRRPLRVPPHAKYNIFYHRRPG